MITPNHTIKVGTSPEWESPDNVSVEPEKVKKSVAIHENDLSSSSTHCMEPKHSSISGPEGTSEKESASK